MLNFCAMLTLMVTVSESSSAA